MNDKTLCVSAKCCPSHHIVSTNLLFSYSTSWCYHFTRITVQEKMRLIRPFSIVTKFNSITHIPIEDNFNNGHWLAKGLWLACCDVFLFSHWLKLAAIYAKLIFIWCENIRFIFTLISLGLSASHSIFSLPITSI